ncbi:MAG: Do family serine endopeptidase [bacterium]
MMTETTSNRIKKWTALCVLAVTFTLLGILFASKMEWTADTKAEPEQTPVEALQSTGLLTAQGESPFVAVVQKAKPAVVNITAKKEDQRQPSDYFNFGPFRDFFHRDLLPDLPRGVTSGGSGIILDRDGYILTNNHVIDGATDITVKDAEGHEYRAEIVGADPESDVALIRAKEAKFSSNHAAELGNSDAIKIGDWAIAIGNPFGLEQTVTVGVISAKGRSNLAIAGGGPSYQNFIQTDASINFGNSGGPLVNIQGQVIGVNTAINTQGQGIGFAIPINLAKSIVQQLRTEGHVVRGYLGMLPRQLDDATREALKLDRDVKGVFVDLVEDGTPAEKGGLKPRDVITHVNGVPIDDPDRFRFMVAEYKPGSRINMDIIRDGKKKALEFTLGNRKDYVTVASAAPKEEIWLGLHVESLDSPHARQLQIEATEGVLVIQVDFNSPAEGRIQAGDVIIEIAEKPVKDLTDYRKVIAQIGATKDAILIRLIRNGRKTFEAIKP